MLENHSRLLHSPFTSGFLFSRLCINQSLDIRIDCFDINTERGQVLSHLINCHLQCGDALSLVFQFALKRGV